MEEKYGRWTVIEEIKRGHELYNGKRATLLCKCDCGTERILDKYTVVNGRTKSCGCLAKNGTMGAMLNQEDNEDYNMKKFYSTWRNIKTRCNNPNDTQYENYGGRGITVCDEWIKFEGFKEDMYDSYLLHIEEHGRGNTSIDRIDVDSGYNKDNCKWATKKEQARNRTDNVSVIVQGVEFKTIIELAEHYNLDYSLVATRYRSGKRDLDLICPIKKSKGVGNKSNCIEVEINGITYESLTKVHESFPYVSISTLSERYKKGLRDNDLIALPRGMKQEDVDKYNK